MHTQTDRQPGTEVGSKQACIHHRSYIPTYLPACLPACLPTYLPTYVHRIQQYIPTYLQTGMHVSHTDIEAYGCTEVHTFILHTYTYV